MIDMEKRHDPGKVRNAYGVEFEFAAAVNSMDDSALLAELRARGYYSAQALFDAYSAEYARRHGVEWAMAVRKD